jgi:hypothetical protein
MAFRQRFLDPWWAVVVVAAALAVVVARNGDVAAAVVVVAAVAVVVALLRAWLHRSRTAPVVAPEPPRPAADSPAGAWLDRAEAAVRALPARGGVVDPLLADLRRVASRLSQVDDAAAGYDVPALRAERSHLVRSVFDTPEGPRRTEHTRAAQVVADRLATYGHLCEARESLDARLRDTVVALEGMTACGTDPTPELDGLRTGLAETEAMSRQVLGR